MKVAELVLHSRLKGDPLVLVIVAIPPVGFRRNIHLDIPLVVRNVDVDLEQSAEKVNHIPNVDD